MYYKSGIIQIDSDLELKDFNWWVNRVSYDWINNIASIEVLMKIETGSVTYSKSFSFPCTTDWTSETALNAILTLDQFQNSTAI